MYFALVIHVSESVCPVAEMVRSTHCSNTMTLWLRAYKNYALELLGKN